MRQTKAQHHSNVRQLTLYLPKSQPVKNNAAIKICQRKEPSPQSTHSCELAYSPTILVEKTPENTETNEAKHGSSTLVLSQSTSFQHLSFPKRVRAAKRNAPFTGGQEVTLQSDLPPMLAAPRQQSCLGHPRVILDIRRHRRTTIPLHEN